MINNVLLGLGSNLNCPERQIRQGLKAIKCLPHTILLDYAPLYRNPAWGRRGQPLFINTVAIIKTRLSPLRLLQYCQRIERAQGRVRKIKWGSRTLDIDILTYENCRMCHASLKLPHPYMHQRDFVRIPMRMLVERNKLYCNTI